MEGWRQRRPGSNAKQPTGKKENTEREKYPYRNEGKNILDTHRPSHGRTWLWSDAVNDMLELHYESGLILAWIPSGTAQYVPDYRDCFDGCDANFHSHRDMLSEVPRVYLPRRGPQGVLAERCLVLRAWPYQPWALLVYAQLRPSESATSSSCAAIFAKRLVNAVIVQVKHYFTSPVRRLISIGLLDKNGDNS